MDKITVLIVDDHALFRTGIRKILETQEDIHVVGEASTGREALEQARTSMPDVVLMDIKMPEMDGVEATRRLLGEMPHVGIVFCTMYEDDEFVFAGLKAGGRGYILKESDPKTMLRAIRAVANGESLLSPTVAQKVLRQFAALPGEGPPGLDALCDDLTDREIEVLTSLARVTATKRSRGSSSSAKRRSRTTSATSFPSYTSATGPRQPYTPSARVWLRYERRGARCVCVRRLFHGGAGLAIGFVPRWDRRP